MVDTIASPNADPKVSDLLGCIADYNREFDKWQKRADKIVKRYRDENRSANNGGGGVKFNILWSNVQTLIPATFAKLPKPDVTRRFRDNDPVARVGGLILERALDYEIQQYPDYAATMKQAVQDRFLPGRGTAWVRYEPHFKAAEEKLPVDGVQVTEDTKEPGEELDYECSPVDYVAWKDFGHSVARTWEEVTRVWRVVYMSKEAVIARFGVEMADKIPYDASPEKKSGGVAGDRAPKQARIYEIWDKEKKLVTWLSKSMADSVIEEKADPLGLDDFWPCPRPLFATVTNETLIPVPDFLLYQDQAAELDLLSERIDGLIKAMQVKGVYDASIPELARLFTEAGNTDLIPAQNFMAFAEKQGLKGSIDIVDLEPFAKALKVCFDSVAVVKEIIYEITGISDIVRGQSSPSETLGAQKIKQNFVGLRLGSMQGEVAKFAAEILSMKAQIICGKYAPATILKISAAEFLSDADKPFVEQAIALLIGPERMADPLAKQGPNPTRRFRIDIESDSLVKMNQQEEKQDRMEFLTAVGAYLEKALPMAQELPTAAPLLVAMLKFGVTAFPVGRTIEGDFDQALDQLKQAAAQPQPQKPNPEMARIAAEQQSNQMRVQADQASAADKMKFEQFKLQMEQQAAQAEAQRNMQMEQFKAQLQAQSEARDQAFERWKVEYTEKMAFAIAQLQSSTQLKTSAMSANAGADPLNAGEVGDTGEAQPKASLADLVTKIDTSLQRMVEMGDSHAQGLSTLAETLSRPKTVTLPDGRKASMQ